MGAKMSLPVMWSEDGAPAQPGRLDLSESVLRLAGGSRTIAQGRELELREIARAYIGRAPWERIGGRMTLVLELEGGRILRIAGVERPGAIRELADQILRVAPA
jgi:hypothetical protein